MCEMKKICGFASDESGAPRADLEESRTLEIFLDMNARRNDKLRGSAPAELPGSTAKPPIYHINVI